MPKPKLIRITTVPISLEKLLTGQLRFMKGYFDIVAVSSEKDKLRQIGKQEGVNTFSISLTRRVTPVRDLLAVVRLYLYLLKEKPSIVHSHTPKAGIVGMMAAYLAGVPIRMHTVAGLPLLETKGLKRIVLNLVERLTYKFATNIYPNSNGLLKIILSEKFTEPSKLKVLGNGSSNGIDLDYYTKNQFSEKDIVAKRTDLNIPLEDFVFVFVGRIVTDKGINELVAAFEQIQRIYSNTSLLLVGPFEDDLDPVSEKTSKQITTNPKIITTGYQDDVREFYALSDALVFPSYREGFPNVVLQAGAMELPSIVSDINGCNEIIFDNENGIIIPVKDENKLFEAMEKIMTNKKLYEKMKSNARAMTASRYDQKEMWQELLKEYKMLQKNI